MSYSALYPEIFTGRTGREMRKHPADVRELLVYFICSPLKSGYGLYKVSLGHVTHDTGRPEASVRESIEKLRALGAIEYDFDLEWVWVREMAKFQFGLPLKPNDFRIRSAKKWYERTLPDTCPFLGAWFDRYAADFHFASDTPPGPVTRRGQPARGLHAPSEGLCTVPVAVPVVISVPEERTEVLGADSFTLRPPAPTDKPPVTVALERFCAAYLAANGRKYLVNEGKDPGLLARLIRATNLAEVLDAIELLYTSTDPQVAKSARDIGALYFHFNRLRQRARPQLNAANTRLMDTRKRILGGDEK